MPRWEVGSKERLQQAAMELFEEQGFEQTSAVQIAKRARLTTRTFFRYFTDKKEVLFADEDALRSALVQEILQAHDVSEPLQAVTGILAEFDWERLAPRESLRRRDKIIASNPYLLERELSKQHQMADELGTALRQRGVGPESAGLAAHVGVHVFRTAYRQWLAAGNDADLATTTDTVMSLLAAIVPATASSSLRRASKAGPRRAKVDAKRARRAR